MTPERLAEIEARAAKATPGPWLADEGHIVNSEHLMIVQVIDRAYWRADNAKRRRDGEFDPHTADDQDFIAHAREDVPALVAEVRRLEKLRVDYHNALLACQRGDEMAAIDHILGERFTRVGRNSENDE